MELPPAAVGYQRSDIAGSRLQRNEAQMRGLAQRMGYDYRKTLVFGPDVPDKTHRVRVAVSRTRSVAVFVPSIEHLEGDIPGEIIAVADVVTVVPENTYARTPDQPEASQGGTE